MLYREIIAIYCNNMWSTSRLVFETYQPYIQPVLGIKKPVREGELSSATRAEVNNASDLSTPTSHATGKH
jgi:hypothetical protein